MTRNALQGMIDGSRSGKREQEVFTPPDVISRLIREWGRIVVDTSADAFRWVPADYHIVGAEGYDGLELPWMDRSYCNPEYKSLKPWLAKASQESLSGFRIALLCPIRPHRKWYRKAVRTATATVEFNPFTFYAMHPEKGTIGPHVSWSKKKEEWISCKFPTPLVLIAWNWQPSPDVWGDMGDVRQ